MHVCYPCHQYYLSNLTRDTTVPEYMPVDNAIAISGEVAVDQGLFFTGDKWIKVGGAEDTRRKLPGLYFEEESRGKMQGIQISKLDKMGIKTDI